MEDWCLVGCCYVGNDLTVPYMWGPCGPLLICLLVLDDDGLMGQLLL